MNSGEIPPISELITNEADAAHRANEKANEARIRAVQVAAELENERKTGLTTAVSQIRIDATEAAAKLIELGIPVTAAYSTQEDYRITEKNKRPGLLRMFGVKSPSIEPSRKITTPQEPPILFWEVKRAVNHKTVSESRVIPKGPGGGWQGIDDFEYVSRTDSHYNGIILTTAGELMSWAEFIKGSNGRDHYIIKDRNIGMVLSDSALISEVSMQDAQGDEVLGAWRNMLLSIPKRYIYGQT